MKVITWKYILAIAVTLAVTAVSSASDSRAPADTIAAVPHGTSFSVEVNLAAIPLLTFSPAIELGLNHKWGLELPVAYNNVNYFTRKVKFRQLTLQPGLKHYFRTQRHDDDCFVGAHFGLSWYNMAFNGIHAFRNRTRSPGWGFGISGGWKHRFTQSRHWYVEAEIGVGWYHLHYDVVENSDRGRVLYSKRGGRWLIDRIAVTIGYQFHTSGHTR